MELPTAAGLETWIGGERVTADVVAAERARALGATLDVPVEGLGPGSPLPPGWHWLYFHRAIARSELGPDGHEGRGGFLPELPGARRMWAGGTLRFNGALRIGDEAERVSTVTSIEPKEGRTGPLVFVNVRHRISTSAGVVLEEDQSLVYRLPSGGAAESSVGGGGRAGAERAHPQGRHPSPADPGGTADSRAPAGSGGPTDSRGPAAAGRPPKAAWREPFATDEVLLFRFSALTFNAHRIHYDHPYATRTEGYPGLVVHGPLVALLLLGAGVRRAGGAGVERYRFRAVRPVFCGEEMVLCGTHASSGALGAATADRSTEPGAPTGGGSEHGAPNAGDSAPGARLWALRSDGEVAMEAELAIVAR